MNAIAAGDLLPISIAMGRGPGGGVRLNIGLQPFQRRLQLVDQDGDDDDDADHDELPDGINIQDDQPGLQDGDNERADDRAHDIALATEEVGAADDDRGHR